MRRRVGTQGISGGPQRTLSLIANSLPCRVVPNDSIEDRMGGRLRETESTVIYFEPGAPVTAKDEVTVNGIVYEVTGAHENSEKRAYRKVLAQQRRTYGGKS